MHVPLSRVVFAVAIISMISIALYMYWRSYQVLEKRHRVYDMLYKALMNLDEFRVYRSERIGYVEFDRTRSWIDVVEDAYIVTIYVNATLNSGDGAQTIIQVLFNGTLDAYAAYFDTGYSVSQPVIGSGVLHEAGGRFVRVGADHGVISTLPVMLVDYSSATSGSSTTYSIRLAVSNATALVFGKGLYAAKEINGHYMISVSSTPVTYILAPTPISYFGISGTLYLNITDVVGGVRYTYELGEIDVDDVVDIGVDYYNYVFEFTPG